MGLPNVLAGRFVVPELLQDDATPGNLAQAALNLFDDTLTRAQAIEALFAGDSREALAADTGATSAAPRLVAHGACELRGGMASTMLIAVRDRRGRPRAARRARSSRRR